MKKVYIGILSMGEVSDRLALVLCKMINNKDYSVELGFVGAKRVEASRNIIAREFLKSECDYLLMIDEDNPPLRNPLELLKEGKDIIVFPTPIMYNKRVMWNIERQDPDKPLTGMEKVKSGGTGCILIKRKVLETMWEAPFDTEVDKFGVTTKGVDIKFCEDARANGFSVWTHWGYPCEHYKRINLLELL